jgi:hypothetical protein
MDRIAALIAMAIVTGAVVPSGAQRGADQARGPLAPGGIAGRVTDAAGVAVKDAFVTALYPEAQRPYGFQPVNVKLIATTNEQGDYVLEDVVPGEYYVIALPRNAAVDARGQPNRQGSANTFHPNGVRVSDAARVRVTMGRAIANITLAPAKLAYVSGVVMGQSGEPVKGGTLGFARGDGLFGLASATLTLRADGAFGVGGLPPGTYHFHYRESPWPPPRGVAAKVSVAKVTVKDDDIQNVRVVPMAMVRGAGRVLIDPAQRSSLPLDAVAIVAPPIDFDGNPGPQLAGQLREDLTFEFKTWPSVSRVRVSGLPRDWTVGAIRLDGADVTAKGIEFVAGKDVTGIEIVLVKR